MQDPTQSDFSSALRLSSYDVERLMRDDSPKARTDILGKVAKQYRVKDFSEHELELAEQIFRIMMKDVEINVRQQLATELKDINMVPRDIILHLAQDVEEVALPVIEMSQVLSDADLVHLIETSRDATKIEAVTRRPKLSERVSDAVVESHYPQAVHSLLKNQQAKVSEKAMQTVVRDFAREPKLMEMLAQRDGLSMGIVEKLMHVTSAKLAAQLKEKYAANSQKLDEVSQKVRESTMLRLLEQAKTDDDIDAVVAELYEEQRLTSSIMFTALARGQFNFFAFALARLAQIPRDNAIKLALDRGALGFKALYAKSDLPESMFEAVRAMMRIVIDLKAEHIEPTNRDYANILARNLLIEAERTEIEHLPYMLALIRGK